jgi:hypothetical protein
MKVLSFTQSARRLIRPPVCVPTPVSIRWTFQSLARVVGGELAAAQVDEAGAQVVVVEKCI